VTAPSAISPNGLALIKKFEGLRLKAYKDSVGVWTIGYGHTKGVVSGMSISDGQADAYLRTDADVAGAGVRSLVTVPIDQNQYDALVSFAFNLGVSALKGSTLLKKLNQGDYHGAADQFSRWVFAGNKKLDGLVKRREAERQLFTKDMG
jgi:lysozyme